MSEPDDTDGEIDSTMLFAQQGEDVEWPIPRLFAEYGRGYEGLIALALVASMTAPLASLLPTYMLQVAIDSVLLTNEPFSLPGLSTESLPEDRLVQLYVVAGIIVGAAGAAAVFNWLGSWAWGRFSQEVQHVVRTDSYEKIQRLGIGFFDDQQTGQILAILNNDVNQLNDLLERFLGDILRIGVQFLGIAAFLLLLHWQLALVALVFVPILAAMSRYFVTRVSPLYESVRQQVGALNARIENNVSGIGVIKAYTAEADEAERVTEASEDVLETRWNVITTRITFFPAMNFVNWLGFGVLIVVGGIWIVDGPPLIFTEPLSVGVLVAFLVYNQQMTTPLIQAAHLVDMYYDARASVVRVFSLHDYEVEIDDEGAEPLERVEGRVTVESVSFSYDDEPALRNVSFDVEPGSFVGIVGPTGSGKTTLTKLLLRFYDPDSGTIRLDGRDLQGIPVRSLRGAIGTVSQEPYLFSGTVRENVAYGAPEATEADVSRAARIANAHEFVSDLPDGYDTQVGQRGVKLSGGQRQRIAIARAVLSEPELLILDEATSHVDNETEALIQNSLSELIADRTTFAIAHRLSTVRHADTILVFDDGEIVERGTHEALLEEEGLYANLWRVQVGELGDLPKEFLETHVLR